MAFFFRNILTTPRISQEQPIRIALTQPQRTPSELHQAIFTIFWSHHTLCLGECSVFLRSCED